MVAQSREENSSPFRRRRDLYRPLLSGGRLAGRTRLGELPKELQARGEILDLRQLAPPGDLKDDLSKVPIFAEVYRQPPPRYTGLIRQDTPKPTRLQRISIYLGNESGKYPKGTNFRKGQLHDLSAWQLFYRDTPQAHLPPQPGRPADDVLRALSQLEPEMSEVEVALSNPKAYWLLDYDRPIESHLGAITGMLHVAQILSLRAAAHLENHEMELAKKDYLFSFAINRSLFRNCLLVNYLVAVAIRALDDSILWGRHPSPLLECQAA